MRLNISHLWMIAVSAILLLPLAAQSRHQSAKPVKDIVEVAVSTPATSTLVKLVQQAGLVKALQAKGPFTVLAPTNAAFEALGQDTLESLLKPQNRAKLAAILKYHVVPGRVTAADAVRAKRATTLLEGGKLNFAIREGSLRVQSSRVVANDVLASNGVIHLIDSVLMPPSELLPQPRPRGRKVIGVTLERPGAALASQLKLDRHRSSVVTRVTKGGPADLAGLRRYDVILSFDHEAGTSKGLSRRKSARDYGATIDVVVIRRGQRRHLKIPIGAERH
jgi:uncharacterized surface protein with fasciclin (FAS1) repeats